MKRKKMFLYMVAASLVRRKSRMLAALLAIIIGATVLSGLVTIYYDVPRQMGAQFRNYGANMIIVPTGENRIENDVIQNSIRQISDKDIVGYAPYKYETLRVNEQPITFAGTDMEGAAKVSPYWFVSGEWARASGEALVGKDVSELLGLGIGDEFTAVYVKEGSEEEIKADYRISGILDTGGNEESYIFVSIDDLTALTQSGNEADIVELSISGGQDNLTDYARKISENDGISAKLVKRVTQSETTVLTKLQALVLLVTVIILILTMVCVATTMMAVVAERRKEIGLRKALGASDGSIITEFMGEALLLGAVGGIMGVVFGYMFAQTVSINVFNSLISFQPLLAPITVVVSIVVTGLACVMPVRNATEIDPALVLKGE